MNVEAIANVKVSSDENVIHNAVERFLGRETGEIRRVSKETLEGHLRSVIANLTPEQVNEDRLRFAEALQKESEEDLRKLGLHLDTLKISHVNDEVGYLDATGRKAIANIIRAAEIAESDAKRSAEQSESENAGRANVRRAEADAAIAKMRNELRKIRAELESRVKSEEERTAAAARQARAEAEQHLQQVRAELEGIRLNVDTVLPAEADRQAQEFRARGDAAEIRERGRAVAEALDALYAAWQKAGPSAMQISIIEDLESIMDSALRGVRKVDVKSLSVIDGGDGRTLKNYIAAYPAMLGEVFEAVDRTVGIDIPGALSGKEKKS
jgi:flotillin